MSETKINRTFQIQGIEVISFSIQHQFPSEKLVNFEFNVQQEQKANAEKQLIFVNTKITVKESENNSPISLLEVACGFEFSDFSNIFKYKEGAYIIPHEISIQLGRISTATCRGILFSQLRSAGARNLVLPLLPIE